MVRPAAAEKRSRRALRAAISKNVSAAVVVSANKKGGSSERGELLIWLSAVATALASRTAAPSEGRRRVPSCIRQTIRSVELNFYLRSNGFCFGARFLHGCAAGQGDTQTTVTGYCRFAE